VNIPQFCSLLCPENLSSNLGSKDIKDTHGKTDMKLNSLLRYDVAQDYRILH
jgi:hypothetical protein